MYTHTNLPIETKAKLIRDKIPDIIKKSEGVIAITKILDDKEYAEKLIEKLHEETEELALAIKDKTNPTEELADILEILHAIAKYLDSTVQTVNKERLKKLKERDSING